MADPTDIQSPTVVHLPTPPGGLVNISVADPTKLKTLKSVLVSSEHNSFVVGTITGITTLYRYGLLRLAVS